MLRKMTIITFVLLVNIKNDNMHPKVAYMPFGGLLNGLQKVDSAAMDFHIFHI
jgi:hypothetical protein